MAQNLDPLRTSFEQKPAMAGVCSTFSFATETTVCRGAEETALKTKTLRKALVFGFFFGGIAA